MRLFTASAIIAAVSLGTPAFVQAQGAPPQSEAQKPPAQSSTVIETIQVVDVKDLKPEVRSKVDDVAISMRCRSRLCDMAGEKWNYQAKGWSPFFPPRYRH